MSLHTESAVANEPRKTEAIALTRPILVEEIDRLFQELTWRGRRHFARRVDAFGLTVPQYVALSVIGKQGPGVTMSEVGESLQLPASTVTSIVDRLVRDGLVERGILPSDRRAVVATLTETGADVVASVEFNRRNDLVEMLSGLDDDNLEAFAHDLGGMLEGLDRLMADPVQSSAA